jgi:putative transcriptional regulator
MKPSHHPSPETLISYASGTLDDGATCVVACHLSLCPECAAEVRWLEMLGGVMLSNLETAHAETPLTQGAVLPRFMQPRAVARPRPGQAMADGRSSLASRLSKAISPRLGDTSWERAVEGVMDYPLAQARRDGAVRLLRLSPGQRLPGQPMPADTGVALVLQGACRNDEGTYVRGDVIERTDELPGLPTAFGEEACICLVTG